MYEKIIIIVIAAIAFIICFLRGSSTNGAGSPTDRNESDEYRGSINSKRTDNSKTRELQRGDFTKLREHNKSARESNQSTRDILRQARERDTTEKDI